MLGKLASPLIGVVVFLTENVKNTWNRWCKSRKRNQFSLFKQRYGWYYNHIVTRKFGCNNWVGETVKHEIKWQEGGFLGMLFRTVGVPLLENINWKGDLRTGKGAVRAGKSCKNRRSIQKFWFHSIL